METFETQVDESTTSEETQDVVVENQQNESWIDTLPYIEIQGGRRGDVDTGEELKKFAHHWNGIYSSETETLRLEPKRDENISEHLGVMYDTRLSRIENDKIIPNQEGGYKKLNTDEYGNIVMQEEECPSVEGGKQMIFRGINYEGMQTALKNSSLGAGPLMKSLGLEESVFFAPKAERAFGYAAKGEIPYASATFEKPSYVVVVDQPENPTVDKWGDIIIKSSVDLDNIHKIYEVRPYAIEPLNIYMRDGFKGYSQETISSWKTRGWKPFMQLEDDNVNDKGFKYVYREVKLEDLKQSYPKTIQEV